MRQRREEENRRIKLNPIKTISVSQQVWNRKRRRKEAKNVKRTSTRTHKGTKVDSRDDVMAEKDLESPYDDCGRLFRTALFLEYHRFPLVLVSYRASTVPVSLNDDVTLPAAQPARNRR